MLLLYQSISHVDMPGARAEVNHESLMHTGLRNSQIIRSHTCQPSCGPVYHTDRRVHQTKSGGQALVFKQSVPRCVLPMRKGGFKLIKHFQVLNYCVPKTEIEISPKQNNPTHHLTVYCSFVYASRWDLWHLFGTSLVPPIIYHHDPARAFTGSATSRAFTGF